MAALAAALAVVLAAPSAAGAALPAQRAELQAHDHETKGRNWHVQLLVSGSSDRLVDTLIFYAEQCDATVVQTRLRVSAAGVVSGQGTIKGGGVWRVDAIFTGPGTAVGVARIIKRSCDTGRMLFTALTEEAHQHVHGPLYPDFSRATTRDLRQAQAMRRRAWQASEELFPTYAAALRRGFRPSATLRWRPMLFHVRNLHNVRDGRIFNSRAPEALVYWWRPSGRHLLVGFMFRVPRGDRPAYAGPIPIYHQHFGKRTSHPMTHVWLTNDLKTAWANCIPVHDLETAHPSFRWTLERAAVGVPGAPCSV